MGEDLEGRRPCVVPLPRKLEPMKKISVGHVVIEYAVRIGLQVYIVSVLGRKGLVCQSVMINYILISVHCYNYLIHTALRFDPPIVPKDFVPHHKFPATLEVNREITETPPTDVPPPADNNLKVLIEGVATLVARCGTLFEELSREKNQSNPLFDFLNGGNGHDYYKRKLWEARQKHTDKIKPLMNVKVTSTAQKLTADNRGNILGEKPLERTAKDLKPDVGSAKEVVNLQFHLSDTFTEPASFVEPTEITKPFQHDPAKQERFEQYLKEKYHGGLRTKDAGGSSKMSEADRARERLEFEAAAEATKQGKWGKESQRSSQQTLAASVGRLQFTSGGLEMPGVNQAEEMIKKSMFPKREEFQWRPASILCKRFDLIDPYMGKPPPAPRSRSKLDSLIFMPDYVKAATHEEKTKSNNMSSPTDEMNGTNTMDVDETVEAENVERPVDLYKAIFSDDSDDEEESSNINQQEDPTKKIEAANTTLSRLVAGDFLESLGKELGLEVPPDQPYPGTHAKPHPTQNSTIDQPPTVGQQSHTQKHDDVTKDIKESRRENDNAELNQGAAKKDKKANKRYESSSEDERSRKRSKRESITSDSSDDRDRRNSRHKERKREHRKHSKHRKHRSHESSSRSRHSADKEYRDSKREKRKSRD
ncbi:G patch domain-containing protein TGH-like [Rutidosis leptorrhynchoides]|uniref:G patch domain-containing protein TGH-like n=1 Tax=Rutidosis leptorrhynchoides TaxID=125765 RepID=UPI003A991FBA